MHQAASYATDGLDVSGSLFSMWHLIPVSFQPSNLQMTKPSSPCPKLRLQHEGGWCAEVDEDAALFFPWLHLDDLSNTVDGRSIRSSMGSPWVQESVQLPLVLSYAISQVFSQCLSQLSVLSQSLASP